MLSAKRILLRSATTRGFTLGELMLCFAALTLVALVAITSFFSQSEVTLHNAARLFAEDVRIAQNRALLLQAPVEIHFEEGGDGYRILESRTAPQHLLDLVPPITRRYSADAVFEGVKILSRDLADQPTLRFDAQGKSTAAATIVFGFAGETRAVVIEAGRGVAQLPDSSRERGWLDWLH